MLDHFPDRAFRNSPIALSESGARPGVVMKVEAVDLRLGVWVLEGTRSRRTGWKWAIHLTPWLVELTGEWRHPRGRSPHIDGNPWKR